jgi:hypothetical protein
MITPVPRMRLDLPSFGVPILLDDIENRSVVERCVHCGAYILLLRVVGPASDLS